ncbi:MAG: trypsin-like peptidase domain-containing protein [Planctomycetota bacterium]
MFRIHKLVNRIRSAILIGAILVVSCSFPAISCGQTAGVFDAAIEQSQSKVVKIFGAGAGRVEGYATGIVASEEGHILTMQGVFLDGGNVRVLLHDGREFDAAILKRNRETQLALLKIQAETPEHFEISAEEVGEKGDWVIALTNAFKVADKDEPLSVMLGVIALRTSMDARLNRRDVAYRGDLVLIDAITSNPGAGGGAVVLTDGRLVGMVGKIINSSDTNTRLNYAVPGSELAAFMEGDSRESAVAEEDSTGPPELGIVIFRHGGRNSPAYIDRVRRGGPAAEAGLRSDDMIITLGGEKVGTVREFDEVLESLRVDNEVIVVVKRGVDVIRVPLTLSADDPAEPDTDSTDEGTDTESLEPDESDDSTSVILMSRDVYTSLAAGSVQDDEEADSRQTLEAMMLTTRALRGAVERVRPSLVTIESFGGVSAVQGRIGGIRSQGEGNTTGVLISSDGLVVTSTFNFIQRPPVITVVTHDGQRRVAKMLGRDDTRKICLLKIEDVSDMQVPEFIDPEELQIGQWAISAGVGYGDTNPAVSMGIISATNRVGGRAVQTDANISPANYGGPLLDIEGRLIGICVPMNPQSQAVGAGVEWYDSGIGFAVPLHGLDHVIDRLKNGEEVEPAFLGILAVPNRSGDGLFIEQIVEGSAAEEAGLNRGDRITGLNGEEVGDIMKLKTMLNRFEAGREIELTFIPADEEDEKTVSIVLGSAQQSGEAPSPLEPPRIR